MTASSSTRHTSTTQHPHSEASEMAPLRLSRRLRDAGDQPISFLMQQAVENPGVLSLAAGLVDFETLPVEETRMVFDELWSAPQTARAALQYGTTAGAERLRTQLLAHFARQEGSTPKKLRLDLSNVIATTGSQQFLSLVAEVLFDPGDICLVAGPTYFVFCGVLNGVQARTITIPQDDDGIVVDAVDEMLGQLAAAGELDRVKLIYVVSDYDNPSGRSISEPRRRQLVEVTRKWSTAHRILILEDAAYRELRYDGPELPSVWSFDESRNHVLYTQTFSKSFSPGIRVGYGIVPNELVQPFCTRKGSEDFGSPNLNQHLLATLLESKAYHEHLQIVRDAYQAKRDAMLRAADREFAGMQGVHWVRPHGGLYVWLSLPESIKTDFNSPLFQQAVQRHQVMYVPGNICYSRTPAASSTVGTTETVDDRPNHQMRLSYGVLSPELIEDGIRRLASAVREQGAT